MKISNKKMIILALQIGIILVMNLFGPSNQISSFGLYITLYSTITLICLVILQKNIVTPINILYITFVLFSAGIPIAYFINNDYYNYYMILFTDEIIFNAAKYTLWSIQCFSFTLLFAINPNSTKGKRIIFSESSALNDENYVFSIARILYIVSSLVVIPLYAVVAYLSVSKGFSQATRALVASNSFFNLSRAFYIPSFFLLCCYGRNSNFLKISKYIFFATCILSLLSGSRTDGILWLIAYIYYNNKADDKKNMIGQFAIALGIGIIVYVAVMIGQNRTGVSVEIGPSILMSAIGEMGFNFTTICFVMSYVPSLTGFKYGLTYLTSILSMVPKSLDVFHIFDALKNSLPIQWLFDVNHSKYNGLLDFGVGFSTVGESYMNFSYFGIIVSVIYALVICNVFSGKWSANGKWERYIQMIVFLAFMTFPRRAFNELLNSIKYSVIILALILILLYSWYKKNMTGKASIW